MPVSTRTRSVTHSGGAQFKLGARLYSLTSSVCLYQYETPAGLSEHMVLTSDMRFAYATQAPDGSIIAAVEMDAAEAREFLTMHGEGDLIEDFPDLFTVVQKTQMMGEFQAASRGTAH